MNSKSFLFLIVCVLLTLPATLTFAGENELPQGRIVSSAYNHDTGLAEITYDYTGATSFRLLMASGNPGGPYQPLVPGMIVKVEFPGAGLIKWILRPNIQPGSQGKWVPRFFKIEVTG